MRLEDDGLVRQVAAGRVGERRQPRPACQQLGRLGRVARGAGRIARGVG